MKGWNGLSYDFLEPFYFITSLEVFAKEHRAESEVAKVITPN